MTAYRKVDDLSHLRAVCTPGSAPGPTLGNEYGNPLPFYMSILALKGSLFLTWADSGQQQTQSTIRDGIFVIDRRLMCYRERCIRDAMKCISLKSFNQLKVKLDSTNVETTDFQ